MAWHLIQICHFSWSLTVELQMGGFVLLICGEKGSRTWGGWRTGVLCWGKYNGLDLKCPPKVPMLKAWSQLLGDGGTLRRWGLIEGTWVIGNMPQKGILASRTLPVFLCPSGPPWANDLPRHTLLLPWYTVQSKAQRSRTKWPWTETSETRSQNNLFLF